MKAAANVKNMTEAEYIAFEEKAQDRHEMINGKLYTMAGASRKHNLICQLLTMALLRLLKGQNFLAFQENMKVQITNEKDYAYPDVVVTFDEEDISSPNNEYIFRKPIFIVEVLSPSTRVYDKTDKFIQYRKIESLKYYLLVDSEKVFVECMAKNTEGVWESEIYTQITEKVILSALNIEIPLSDIYPQ